MTGRSTTTVVWSGVIVGCGDGVGDCGLDEEDAAVRVGLALGAAVDELYVTGRDGDGPPLR